MVITNSFRIKPFNKFFISKKFFSVVAVFCTLWAQQLSAQTTNSTTTDFSNENASVVYIEEKTQKNYFTQKDGNAEVIIQNLTWQEVPYAKWYEVYIEVFDDNEQWVPVTNAIYENKSIYNDFPIPEYLGEGLYKIYTNNIYVVLSSNPTGEPRKYRYCITSYNLLNKKSFTSDFNEIEILNAIFPSIYSTNTSLIYLDDIFDSTIKLSGNNFTSATKFYLSEDNKRVYPIETTVKRNGKDAEITFDKKTLPTGYWQITAENPGEFTSTIPLEIRFMKWYELYLSVGYAPTVFLYNEIAKEYLGSHVNILAGDFKLTFIPIKKIYGYFGLALNGKVSYSEKEFPITTGRSYTIGTILSYANIALVYRYPIIKNRLLFDCHFGPGIASFNGMKFTFPQNITSDLFNGIYFSFGAGVGISFTMWKNIALNIGVDTTYTYVPKLHPIQLHPVIGIELRF